MFMWVRPQNGSSAVVSELYWRRVKASPSFGREHHPALWWAVSTGSTTGCRKLKTNMHTCSEGERERERGTSWRRVYKHKHMLEEKLLKGQQETTKTAEMEGVLSAKRSLFLCYFHFLTCKYSNIIKTRIIWSQVYKLGIKILQILL